MNNSLAYLVLSKRELTAILAQFAGSAPDYACLTLSLAVNHRADLRHEGANQAQLACEAGKPHGLPVVCDYRNSVEFARSRTDLHARERATVPEHLMHHKTPTTNPVDSY